MAQHLFDAKDLPSIWYLIRVSPKSKYFVRENIKKVHLHKWYQILRYTGINTDNDLYDIILSWILLTQKGHQSIILLSWILIKTATLIGHWNQKVIMLYLLSESRYCDNLLEQQDNTVIIWSLYILKSVMLTAVNFYNEWINCNRDIDGVVQDCSNSSALAMESCTKPSIYPCKCHIINCSVKTKSLYKQHSRKHRTYHICNNQVLSN